MFCILMAERQGFEPWVTCATTVFKTVPFNRSGISPKTRSYVKELLLFTFFIQKWLPPTGFGLHYNLLHK